MGNVFIARHNSMTRLCRALFKCENKQKNCLRNLMHSFEVHPNESACIKSGHLGLEQVIKHRGYDCKCRINSCFIIISIYIVTKYFCCGVGWLKVMWEEEDYVKVIERFLIWIPVLFYLGFTWVIVGFLIYSNSLSGHIN